MLIFFLQKLPKNKPQLFLFENNVHLNSPKVAINFSLKNATRIFQKSPNLVTLQSAITIYETKREKNRNIDSLWRQVDTRLFVLRPVQVDLEVALNPAFRFRRISQVQLDKVVEFWKETN